MTIKMRLALLFTFLVACILATFTWAVYTYSSYQRSKGFFAQLQTDAIASATITLRSDNLSEAALEPFHRKLQEKLPLENVDIFDKNHVSVFHAGDRHLQLDDEAAEAANRLGLYTKTVGDTQKVFFPFDDEDVHYVVAISAVDFPGLANLYKLRLGLIAALAASLVIVFVAGVWFAGRAMAPIVSITRQAEGISAAGLHVRIAEGPQKDELTQLAHAFNQMLNRLEDAFQAQKQFLANVSHELRTPLTTLEGQLELALMKGRSETEYRDVLAATLDDTRRLRSSTNNLLLLARAEARGLELSDTPQRMDEILFAVLAEAKQRYPGRVIDFQFIPPPENENDLRVTGNKDLLHSACLNILENAIRYSDPSTTIRIEVHTDGKIFSLKVIDQGLGIESADLRQVFQPFFRCERTWNIPGSGIGLTLVEAIVKRHQGFIDIQSQPNLGTTVAVRFPVRDSQREGVFKV
jgi:signal transduction histidine kinase